MKNFIFISVILLTLVGCAAPGVQYVDTSNDTADTVIGLEYRDFEKAASESVQSMLGSGAVNNPAGGRYVLAISTMINDTTQRIDTDQLVKKIRVALLQSGKVVVTTAIGANGAEDNLTFAARELRDSDEVDQSSVAGKGTIIAPELSLSGKIMQNDHKLSGGGVQVEYSFQLTLTHLETGLAYWEGETPIVKRGSSSTVTW
jgi:uncharacterized protein (TIGR02722 family)